ncbi:MAG: hypothetical protein JKY65_30565 [Planctomycetes bacterium]|nr:hypothetical protein [Planctomycetota bacterium]
MARTWLAFPLLAVALAAPAAAEDAKVLARRYAETKDSWQRRTLVEGLDASDPGSRKFLLGVLAKEPWYQREGAIEALAKISDEGEWGKLLKERKTPILEGVARALGRRSLGLGHNHTIGRGCGAVLVWC